MNDLNRPAWMWIFPPNAGISMIVWACVSGGVGFLMTILGTTVFKEYGFALFCGVPMLMGILAPFLHGMGAPRSFGSLLAANVLSQICLFFTMLGMGAEGLGCLIMCAPLWFICALTGTAIAYPLHHWMWRFHVNPRGFPVAGLILIVLVPMWMGAEHESMPVPEIWPVTTSVEIAAPPEIVWQAVIAFPELPPPTDWIFNLGVAYPKHAVIVGHGVGATRYCVFSTGAFVEPIRTWDEKQLLAFDVAQSPPSMKERNPFWDIHPAHLEGYLVSKHGQFELIDLGNGHTRLIGTTWYQNNMFPASYWRLWSDMILHKIHMQVLTHIKTLSESTARQDGEGGDHGHL